MKSKFYIIPLIGVFACGLVATAQDTNPPAAENPPAVAPAAVPAETAPATINTETQPVVTAPVAPAETAPATAVEATPATPTTVVVEASTNATETASTASTVVPTIMMTDATLTQAIELLARQAKINYILDPKVSYGPPDSKGNPAPAPIISFRWDNVTAQQALTTLLTTYSLQLVQDPKTSISRITVKDPTAPDPLSTRVIQLKYAGVSNIIDSVRTAITDPKRSRVTADVRTSQLVVLATEKELNDIDKLVERLDTPTKQVLIEA